MPKTIFATLFAFTCIGHATPTGSCGADLAGHTLLPKLDFTGWNSQHGTYDLLEISGVRQAKLGHNQTVYVFDRNDGGVQIFRRISIDFKRYGDRRGQNGTVALYIHRLGFVEVGANGEDVGGDNLEVTLTRQNDGFLLEKWAFEKDGRAQELFFFNQAKERAASERHGRELQGLANIPDPGSKAGIRQEIIDSIRADGLDPAQQLWVGDEVQRQYADMWRHLTR